MPDAPAKVMVAGIGGASLGTEVLKCLKDTETYDVYACDISEFAYGHYEKGVAMSFVVDRERYIESILDICKSHGIQAIIPGGEEPLILLSRATRYFKELGVFIASNSSDLIATCSDKKVLFERLKEVGLPTPWTIVVKDVYAFEKIENISYPCVIKPTTGTGGSKFVFLASSRTELTLYLNYLFNNGKVALIQEYIPLNEGEFTIGILSLPNGQLVGSVAMQRLFHAKLSVLTNIEAGLISSGYSQGLIDEFPEVRVQAERIARMIGSVGPLNIQGRLHNGVLLPFEINPRFSASTYLRMIAGFNEIDIYLRYVLFGIDPDVKSIRPGYYLRSLSEVRVSKEEIKR
jgi:carbamoyl-phosphate synthase large subunit